MRSTLDPMDFITPRPDNDDSQASDGSQNLTPLSNHVQQSVTSGKALSVVVDRMDPNKKSQYTDLKLKVYEIAEDHEEDSTLYYYALLGGGLYHKIKAKAIQEEYPNLVEDYERKKAKGILAPFDPSGSHVHPSSRIRITISLKKDRVDPSSFYNSVKPVDKAVVIEDSDDASSESEEVADFSEYEEDGSPVKPPKRNLRRVTLKLPYSPRKTRSNKRFVTRGSGSEDSEVEEMKLPARRSNRIKSSSKAVLDDDYTAEEDSDSSDDYEGPSKVKAEKRKKVVRGKASRPAYGNFRVVADLDFDGCSDQETAPLRFHRDTCEKCHKTPSHVLLNKPKTKTKGRSRKKDEFEDEHEGDDKSIAALGGWVRCLKCPISCHWKCLNLAQRTEILNAALERDTEEYYREQAAKDAANPTTSEVGKQTSRAPVKRLGLDAYQTTEFICNYCIKGSICLGCNEIALEPDRPPQPSGSAPDKDGDIAMTDTLTSSVVEAPSTRELFFRCSTCKRLAHYAHLPKPIDMEGDASVDTVTLALHYQENDWMCADCSSYVYPVDRIIAWRPSPANAVEPEGEPNYKDQLPREYLIKWRDRSYRRTQWVPHMWLLSTHVGKLSNFVQGKSPRLDLLKDPVGEGEDVMDVSVNDRMEGTALPVAFCDIVEEPSVAIVAEEGILNGALPDAQRRIPSAWQTIDRVLDVLMWATPNSKPKKGKGKVIESEESDGFDEEAEMERIAVFNNGEQPSDKYTATIPQWEKKMRRKIQEGDIDQVIWTFAKWKDLSYEESSWDSPSRRGEQGYLAFEHSFKRFLAARDVHISKLSNSEAVTFDTRPEGEFKKMHALKGTPDLGQSDKLNLMEFQVDGVNWICNNWWTHQHCILADEMGLGKTIQIVAFIGIIVQKFQASPCLVVVPNSTITNWVREFERWAPHLRVVPYYGEAKSREIIRNYELTHNTIKPGTTGAKYNVLITTYETVTSQKEFSAVFNKTPRWEALVVDEGQRLKNDSSLIFKKLKDLNTMHRIILTGTPLNNNIRELFNLMNFLDPEEWYDLQELEKEHEELTEELVAALHGRLRPYFLRRIKTDVLELPPKNEVIVPVSMTPLQREIYKGIFSQNLEVLKSLTNPANAKTARKLTKTNMNNMLMQLRKCLQHPYLVSPDIEPKDLPLNEVHGKLIDASAKFILLKTMLPKLKARGHRVLLFSQFKMVLDVIEDFLHGENIKYLRLDGDTASLDRQKGIDEFNAPGSDVFVYLLTTRAGGVGINLYTADTVIIFDPDFNPHQAIARSHRYGQKKICLVFKLMVKNSAEDRIIQVGKKKLALDHVIVQKMDEDGGEDVQSILTFGAQQLFEQVQEDRGIVYTDADIESLIEKTEKEGDQIEEKSSTTFSFAKVWSADKDGLEEMTEANPDADQSDSWAQTLQRIALDREKVQAKEVTGRGAKRKAAAVFPQQQLDQLMDSPEKLAQKKSKKNKSRKSIDSDDSDVYMGSVKSSSDTDATSRIDIDPEDMLALVDAPSDSKAKQRPLASIDNGSKSKHAASCGLCGSVHIPGTCYMTEMSKNLADFRLAIMNNVGQEQLEIRRTAIQAIDETLSKRGDLSLIHGQPLYIVGASSKADPPPKKQKQKVLAANPDRTMSHAVNKGGPSTSSYPTAGPSKRASSPRKDEPPKKQKQKVVAANPVRTMSHAVNKEGPSTSLYPAAGPSKRASSPRRDELPTKKPKTTVRVNCLVCGESLHNVNDCPLVLAEPSSITRAMKKLQKQPMDASAMRAFEELRKLLVRQKRPMVAS